MALSFPNGKRRSERKGQSLHGLDILFVDFTVRIEKFV
jgi:hypothetical protein